MAQTRKYYSKNNYLILRSTMFGSNIIDLSEKIKKIMVRTSFAEKKQKKKKKKKSD
jgi:hypothetical protein